MKEWVKRYWWIAVLVLVLPVVINFVLQIPAFTPIVGDSESWLSFWGGYLGAIISASVAFVILAIQSRQNKEENQANRKLQINVIKHQQEQARLQNIINASAKLISDTGLTKISIICCKMGGPNSDIVSMLEDIVKDVDNHRNELDLYVGSDSNVSTWRFKLKIDNQLYTFCNELNAISNIARLFIYHKGNVSIPLLKDHISKSELFLDEIKESIINYADSVGHALDNHYFYEIATIMLKFMSKTQLDICDCIKKYVSAEKDRIDNVLTENTIIIP